MNYDNTSDGGSIARSERKLTCSGTEHLAEDNGRVRDVGSDWLGALTEIPLCSHEVRNGAHTTQEIRSIIDDRSPSLRIRTPFNSRYEREQRNRRDSRLG